MALNLSALMALLGLSPDEGGSRMQGKSGRAPRPQQEAPQRSTFPWQDILPQPQDRNTLPEPKPGKELLNLDAYADSFPQDLLNMLQPSGAGGAADLMGRTLPGQDLGKAFFDKREAKPQAPPLSAKMGEPLDWLAASGQRPVGDPGIEAELSEASPRTAFRPQNIPDGEERKRSFAEQDRLDAAERGDSSVPVPAGPSLEGASPQPQGMFGEPEKEGPGILEVLSVLMSGFSGDPSLPINLAKQLGGDGTDSKDSIALEGIRSRERLEGNRLKQSASENEANRRYREGEQTFLEGGRNTRAAASDASKRANIEALMGRGKEKNIVEALLANQSGRQGEARRLSGGLNSLLGLQMKDQATNDKITAIENAIGQVQKGQGLSPETLAILELLGGQLDDAADPGEND